MKHRALRTALLVLLVLALIGGGVYAAVRYGSQDDPLVTMSYLTDVAERELTDQLDARINAAVANAQAEVQSSAQAAAGVYHAVDLTAGKTIRCDAGTELLLLSGKATASGAFADATSGEALASGGSLTVNHLYLAAENGASVRADGAVSLMVRGVYSVG